MKDKKFIVLLLLLTVWIALFVGTMFGDVKLNPNVERAVTFLLLGYGAYWTFSYLFDSNKPEVKDEKTEEPSKAPDHTDLPKV